LGGCAGYSLRMASATVIEEVSREQTSATEGARWWWGWFALASVAVLALGAVEGWCGRTDSGDVYGSDGVQYLDVARAFERGDFKSALNPLWSQGYPALLAMVRPMFGAGPDGDWAATRWLNLGVFCFSWACFAWFVRTLLKGRERTGMVWVGAACVFIAAQICVDQVSRVGPDQLVAGLFFLVCGLVLRLRTRRSVGLGVGLGLVLGVGYLVKAVFLPLGCVVLVVTAAVVWFGHRRLRETAIAAGVFAVIVLGYGTALSRVVGKPTLGESGSLNYAWHVDRLAKWVHWEGGNDSAAKAWPKPWIARFAQWESDPPDFGVPVHPSVRVGSEPMIYVFHAPVKATYVPYYDPAYWYHGYRHIVRWRYQVVALGKSFGDLAVVLARQPLFWAFGLVMLWSGRKVRWRELETAWPVVAIAVLGVLIYLPVHLEGRYLSGFLAVIGVVLLVGILGGPATHDERQRHHEWGTEWWMMVVLLMGFGVGLVRDQAGIWVRAGRGWTPRENVEWRAANGVRALGLPRGSEVGVIAWTPNLHSDWAYMSELQITSEIASPEDETAFWRLSADGQVKVLGEFRDAGAKAIFTWDKPEILATGWQQVAGAPMWVYRF
jgi:hypothetical protein